MVAMQQENTWKIITFDSHFKGLPEVIDGLWGPYYDWWGEVVPGFLIIVLLYNF